MQGEKPIEKAGLRKAQDYAHELAKKIRQSGFAPTLVVGIETGGHLIGKIVARDLGARFETMRVRRKTSRASHSDKVRRRIGTKHTKMMGKILNLIFPALNPKLEDATVGKLDRVQRVLVVDDGARSGKTMRLVKRLLIQKGADPSKIKTAAANAIGRKYRPDFFLTTRNISWPWGLISPEYRIFRKWQKRERKQKARQQTKRNIKK